MERAFFLAFYCRFVVTDRKLRFHAVFTICDERRLMVGRHGFLRACQDRSICIPSTIIFYVSLAHILETKVEGVDSRRCEMF